MTWFTVLISCHARVPHSPTLHILLFSFSRAEIEKAYSTHCHKTNSHTEEVRIYPRHVAFCHVYRRPHVYSLFPLFFFFPFFFSSSLLIIFFAFYKGWFGELGNRNLQFWRELSVWHGCVGEYISWLGGLHIDKVSCFSFSFFPFFKI